MAVSAGDGARDGIQDNVSYPKDTIWGGMMLLCIITRTLGGTGPDHDAAGPTPLESIPMSDAARQELAEHIAVLLERCRLGREQITAGGALRPAFALLASWQSGRLAWTHSDLLASPRFGPAARFFLSDLYGDQDYSPRDEGMERVYPVMIRLMPAGALKSIAMGITMHAMTQELDVRMVEVLFDEMGVTDQLDADLYAEAYRRCNNAADRARQIRLISEIGHTLDDVVHHALIYNMVRLARRPARMAGFGPLHDFIERGFSAFRHLDGASRFLQTIDRRETRIMESILAGRPTETWSPPQGGIVGPLIRPGDRQD